MPFIIALVYLFFFWWERSEKRKANEAEQRRKQEIKKGNMDFLEKSEAKKAYDKKLYDEWKDLVYDVALERKVRLYILDEKNRAEYEPWLMSVYRSFKREPNYSLAGPDFELTRHYTDKDRIANDPLELRAQGLLAWERHYATALMMAERGKIPERLLEKIEFRESESAQNFAEDMAEYVSKKLSQKHPGHKIGYQMYGIQWARLKIPLSTRRECYWVHNGNVMFNAANPDNTILFKKQTIEKIQNPTLTDNPEDIEYVKRELKRMDRDYERRYLHLDEET